MQNPDNVMQAWHRLRFALGAAGIGTWHLDLATGIASYDESLNEMLGLEPVETHAPLDERLHSIHPLDRAQVRAAIEGAVAARGEFTSEFRIVRPDGSVRWLRDHGRIVAAQHGRGLVASGAVMDVTERRRGEEHDRMLAEATQVLAAAVDCEAALTSIVTMLAQRFASCCSIHLQDDEQLRLAASGGDERLAAPEMQLIEVVAGSEGMISRHALVLPLRVGGETFGAIAYLSQDRAFEPADVVFARELADRLALSIDRDRLFQDLERANRVKDEFLATLSHELRTPLNAVLGWTRMLRRGTIPPERTASILETIERNAAAQMQLVEELLDLSSMAAGGLRLNVTRVDLRDLIGGAVETVRPAADAKSQRLNLAVGSTVSEVAGDPARLRQVLWNLLANAVKFTPAGGAVDIAVVEGAADVEITVRDTGPGIATGFPAARVRTVSPGRLQCKPHGGWPRARPGHRPSHCRSSRRHRDGAKRRSGSRLGVLGAAADRTSAAGERNRRGSRFVARTARARGRRRRVDAGTGCDDAADVRGVGADRRPGNAGDADSVGVASRRPAHRYRDAG